MRWPKAAIAVTLLAGCARWGFGPSDAQSPGDQLLEPASSRDGAGRESATPTEAGGKPAEAGRTEAGVFGPVSAANDSCQNPYVLNMANLASATLAMDFTGAQHDQNIPCCFGAPDLVVRVENAPAILNLRCEGGGAIQVAHGAVCPANVSSCYSGLCSLGNSISTSTSPTYYLVICRPGGGPLTLVLAPDSP